jgi:predicted metalloprotease
VKPFIALAAALLLIAIPSFGCDEEAFPERVGFELGERKKIEIGAGPWDAAEPSVETLESFEPLKRADSEKGVPGIRGSANATYAEWLDEMSYQSARFWKTVLNAEDVSYEPPFQVIYTGRVPVGGGCGEFASQDDGPFYCTGNNTIYLPVNWFRQSATLGTDAALAVVVAHEHGHHIQNLARIWEEDPWPIQEELQADCLAGVWASSLVTEDSLEPGDVGEILDTLWDVADPDSYPVDRPDSHGNFAEREAAFMSGFERPEDGCPLPPVPDGPTS